MQNMIYGECPEFDDLLHTIKKLEEEINHPAASQPSVKPSSSYSHRSLEVLGYSCQAQKYHFPRSPR